MKNKVYIPLLDIYLEEIAIFYDGGIILSYDSLYYQILNTEIFIDDGFSEDIYNKWLAKSNGYTFEALVPIYESGDWIYIEPIYVSVPG